MNEKSATPGQIWLSVMGQWRSRSHRQVSPSFPYIDSRPMNATLSGDTPRRRPRPMSVDVIAATVALEAALPANLLADLGRGRCMTIVITVPSPGWCEPIKEAFFGLLDKATPNAASVWKDTAKFVRDGSERSHRANVGDDEVVSAIAGGRSILGVAPDPARQLPRRLSTAPDHHVIVRPLSAKQLQGVIADVTGRKGRRPPADELIAGLDPADIAIAIRRGSKLADCEDRLRKLAAARVVQIDDSVPHLENLSGCDEAREWGLNLAKDIALYREGSIKWNEVPAVGAIMVGPPGVGKTQVAKSLAKTLGIPLVSTSYAAWQSHREGHLGDLLAEMKRSAMEALALTPSVWFIDEIDSMANRNDADLRYREWHVTVCNGLLALCERAARPGVVLLGAANDISRMDAALMRPGRFGDRILEIPLPDETALAGIMRHHLAGDLAATDLMPFAQCALGATGANVAEWVRSARRAARNERRAITSADLMLQIAPADDRSVDDIRRAAIHEAGHCVALALTGQKVDFVSIRKTAAMGGQTTAPQLGTDFPTREDFERTISVLLAGRAAEEVLIGAPSASASGGPHSDLARATDLVVGMHAAFGLGKAPVVHVHFRRASDMLRADAGLRRAVDENMSKIYRRTLQVISENRRAVTLVAERLIAVRHLDWNEIQRTLKSAAPPATPSTDVIPAPTTDEDKPITEPRRSDS